jgi:hypothetical protein
VETPLESEIYRAVAIEGQMLKVGCAIGLRAGACARALKSRPAVVFTGRKIALSEFMGRPGVVRMRFNPLLATYQAAGGAG